MDVSSQCHILATLYPWVGPRVGLVVAKINNPFLIPDRNQTPDVQPMA